MFNKIVDSLSIKSKTPKSTPPTSAPPSRPSSPTRGPSSSSFSTTSTPISSRRTSLAEGGNNNFPGMNPAHASPSGLNNFTGMAAKKAVRNNFTGTRTKKAVRNNFFGVDTGLANDFGVMNPQETRNNFPGDC